MMCSHRTVWSSTRCIQLELVVHRAGDSLVCICMQEASGTNSHKGGQELLDDVQSQHYMEQQSATLMVTVLEACGMQPRKGGRSCSLATLCLCFTSHALRDMLIDEAPPATTHTVLHTNILRSIQTNSAISCKNCFKALWEIYLFDSGRRNWVSPGVLPGKSVIFPVQMLCAKSKIFDLF